MATKQKTNLNDFLSRLDACEEAREWAEAYSRKPATAWRECPRGDWMLWLMGQFSGKPESTERKRLVLCACECARLAPPIKNEQCEQARLYCLETTEQWAKDEEGATIQEVRKARASAASAAYAAAYAADAAADAAAADAADAAYAAYAASAASAAASAAAYAADAAAASAAAYAADAADAAARKETIAQAAIIVRRHYPWKEIKDLLLSE
jgi:hypothetical protein